MKRVLLVLVASTALAIAYVWMQVRIVGLSYRLKDVYEQVDSLMCTQQYLIARLLRLTSPGQVKERLLARQVSLSYSAPVKVVRIKTSVDLNATESTAFSRFFGMPQASADE